LIVFATKLIMDDISIIVITSNKIKTVSRCRFSFVFKTI